MTPIQMTNKVYNSFLSGTKKFAILIDPDKIDLTTLESITYLGTKAKADYFFVGGSLLVNSQLDKYISIIKQNTDIPVVLFPGSNLQISDKPDAILFLSLISGRNAELLIGQQVAAAPILKAKKIEVIGTGDMLIDGGVSTTVS